MNILSGGLLPNIHSTLDVSQKNVASSKPCLLKNTGCSKKSSLKNLESGVGTLDFWTNVGHPAHLGCLCQFEPLWPKKILLTMFGTQCVWYFYETMCTFWSSVSRGERWSFFGSDGVVMVFILLAKIAIFPNNVLHNNFSREAKQPCVMFFCNWKICFFLRGELQDYLGFHS